MNACDILYIYIYLAKPKIGAAQFLFNGSYSSKTWANEQRACLFFLFLFIYFFTFYDERGEPFSETVYAHFVALALSKRSIRELKQRRRQRQRKRQLKK